MGKLSTIIDEPKRIKKRSSTPKPRGEARSADFSREREFWDRGVLVAGVDEAGRGAFAGPVVAASVVFAPHTAAPVGVRDSKTVPEAEREELYHQIVSTALCWGVGIVEASRIDEINILEATFEAMHHAISSCHPTPQHLLIDGNRFRGGQLSYDTIVGGDGLSLSIAAASIVAKVTRDRLMRQADIHYPDFGLGVNKGYGTSKHRQLLRIKGPSPIHRHTFLRKLLSSQTELFGDHQ